MLKILKLSVAPRVTFLKYWTWQTGNFSCGGEAYLRAGKAQSVDITNLNSQKKTLLPSS